MKIALHIDGDDPRNNRVIIEGADGVTIDLTRRCHSLQLTTWPHQRPLLGLNLYPDEVTITGDGIEVEESDGPGVKAVPYGQEVGR